MNFEFLTTDLEHEQTILRLVTPTNFISDFWSLTTLFDKKYNLTFIDSQC